jgi:hypothetical protein
LTKKSLGLLKTYLRTSKTRLRIVPFQRQPQKGTAAIELRYRVIAGEVKACTKAKNAVKVANGTPQILAGRCRVCGWHRDVGIAQVVVQPSMLHRELRRCVHLKRLAIT